MSGTRVLLAAFLASAFILPTAALAAPTARMSAAFTPEHLGAPTTVSFAFAVHDGGDAPAPLSGVSLSYPRGLGLATSDLGVMPCPPAPLEASGPAACPPDSHMGAGTALVEIAFGPHLVQETVHLTLFAGPSPDGYLHMLVYASGAFPVEADVLMTSVLFPGHLSIAVPPIPSLPAAPYVSLAEMHITLGGHLTYYETVHGRRVAYHPAGVGLPASCPRGGFPFAATFSFISGPTTTAHASVACPRVPRR